MAATGAKAEPAAAVHFQQPELPAEWQLAVSAALASRPPPPPANASSAATAGQGPGKQSRSGDQPGKSKGDVELPDFADYVRPPQRRSMYGPIVCLVFSWGQALHLWWALYLAPLTATAAGLSPVVAVALCFAVTLMLALQSLAIVRSVLTPPAMVPPEEQLELNGVPLDKLRQSDSPLLKEQLSLCKQCDRYRPLSAHHCRMCGGCVLSFDHHCPAVNNCVNVTNYKFFMLVLLYSAIGISIMMTANVYVGHTKAILVGLPVRVVTAVTGAHTPEFLARVTQVSRPIAFLPMLVSWILTFFGLLMVPMMGVFCVVHLIFIANGYTTFEFLKLSEIRRFNCGPLSLIPIIRETPFSILWTRFVGVFGRSLFLALIPVETRRDARLRLDKSLVPLKMRVQETA